jgi:hypothetical protein
MATSPPLNQDFIASLARGLDVELAALQAVVAVESSGRGLLPEGAVSPEGRDIGGFPVIRFEAHVFRRELVRHDVDPRYVKPSRPDLIRKRREDGLVKSVEDDWDRLFAARLLSRDAADSSASWGMFQIMGFNWALTGAGSVQEFVRSNDTLEGQAELFVGFVRESPSMLRALRQRDWTAFARLYNGPGYAKNGYHVRLAENYGRLRKVK